MQPLSSTHMSESAVAPPPPPRTPHTPPASGVSTRPNAVPRWHLHRRLYDWVLAFSSHRQAAGVLFLLSAAEAVFFPIPSLVLQIPMTLADRPRAWWHAAINTAGSVAGGLVGYQIGHFFGSWVRPLFGEAVLTHFSDWTGNVWLLTGGAIAVHPYKIFTIAAGILNVPLFSFIIASLVGRGLLFFAIAAMLWKFGPPVKIFIERYFNALTIAFGVLVVGVIVLAQTL